MAGWLFLLTSTLITWSLNESINNLWKHLISKACVLFSSSAVNVHDTQAYRNMEITRKSIRFTVDPRDILFSLQADFSFVRAAVAWSILERICGFNFSSETIASRYLKHVTVPSFCPFTSLISFGCHQRCLSWVWSSQH